MSRLGTFGAALVVLSCGQSAPNGALDSADAGLAPSTTLPAPPTERCELELTCEERIQDEPKVPCDLVVTVGAQRVYTGQSAVEKRGRSSLAFPKPNYAVELREMDGQTDRPADFYGFGRDEDWVLDGSWVDRSFVRNTLVLDLFRAFSSDWYAPESAYCELRLNGEYQGLYRLVERIKRGPFRVAIAKDDGQGKSFVIRQDEDGALRFELGLEGRWDPIYPKDATSAQREGMQTWLASLERALRARSDGADGVFQLLNRQNVIDWVLLQEFAKNVDAYKLSVYLTRDSGGLGQLVPWDFDLAFGQPEVSSGSENLRKNHEPSGWVAERTGFVRDLTAVPGFVPALATRWRQLRTGPLSTTVVLAQLDAYKAIIVPVAAANFDRWPIDEVRFEQIYGPYHLYEVTSFEAEMSHLRDWIEQRLVWIDSNIENFDAR